MDKKGSLYLIPVTLGECDKIEYVLPELVKEIIKSTDYYIVENEKAARRAIKKILPEKKQSTLNIQVLDKHDANCGVSVAMLNPIFQGNDVGVMSDAGCPGVADPGALVVKLAHQNQIKVVPLVGPSSILLALMASGFNGQNFAFNGYLPIDKQEKKNTLKLYEKLSYDKGQSQIFIETPYRNNKLLEDLLLLLQPNTYLCIACDITLESEYIKTLTVKDWKKQKVDLHNRPCIFIIHKF
ncbi:MAG: SAM-dependent methyltransferase [Bacteroidota bacterium]|nr:SAM-dependent methyltransferase [Bacteroidota bacterium]